MVHSLTGKILLRGNDFMRAHNRCNDIEGAQPKKMRQRSVPTNPLDPAYQPLESIVLPPKTRVSRDELEEEKALGAGPVPWSGTASLGMDASGHLLHLSRQTELAELWKSQGELSMQGRRTRKDYRDTNKTSDIEGAQPAPLLGRNGEGKPVVDTTRDGLATVASLEITRANEMAASPLVHPNEPRPRHPREPAQLPYPSVKDEDVRSKDERMVTRLLASGYSAAEAQRMMRRNQAIGGRAGYGAVERAAGWGRSTLPIALQRVGKKTFTDTAYETHMETHIDMPGLRLVQRPVGRMPLHIPPADEPTQFKKRLDARRAEAAAEAAEAKAAEEARRRRMRRIASAPALTDEQVMEQYIANNQWKSYVGVFTKANSGRAPAPAALDDLRPPRGDPTLWSLNNQDIPGSRPRGDVPPGAPGGPRERRQRREPNWTLDEPRVPGMRLRAGGVVQLR